MKNMKIDEITYLSLSKSEDAMQAGKGKVLIECQLMNGSHLLFSTK